MLKVAELKPPTCEEIKPLIPMLVKEELTPVQRGTVLAHFLHCSQCAEEYQLQLEHAVAVGEVRLPHLRPDTLERARRRMKEEEVGISIFWNEIKGKTSRWAQEKKEAIFETLNGLVLLLQPPLQPQPAGIRTRGAIRTRGGVRRENAISAGLLNSDLKAIGETVSFEITSEPQFTSDGRFHCELVTDELRFEGYTLSLTINSEEQPVVTFTAELIKTEDEGEEKLKATFSEEGFDDVSPSLVPIENIRLQVLPTKGV